MKEIKRAAIIFSTPSDSYRCHGDDIIQRHHKKDTIKKESEPMWSEFANAENSKRNIIIWNDQFCFWKWDFWLSFSA